MSFKSILKTVGDDILKVGSFALPVLNIFSPTAAAIGASVLSSVSKVEVAGAALATPMPGATKAQIAQADVNISLQLAQGILGNFGINFNVNDAAVQAALSKANDASVAFANALAEAEAAVHAASAAVKTVTVAPAAPAAVAVKP